MKIHVLTLFPEMFTPVTEASILGKAGEKGILDINLINIRDYSNDKHSKADDTPFGGGVGAGVKVTPVAFLIIKEGSVRMLPVAAPANTTADRLVEMVPDTLDKIAAFIDSRTDKKAE